MPSTATDRIDGLTTSVAVKAPTKTSSSSNIMLYGEQTIGGIDAISGDRVLVRGQMNPSENGIYVVSDRTWSRAKDFDGARDVVKGTLVFDVGSQAFWQVDTSDPIIIGTSNIHFIQASLLEVESFLSVESITALVGLPKASLAHKVHISVGGYYDLGDGGGGLFYWDSVSTETENGGTVFEASEGGTGRWKRIYDGNVFVNWFGAVGDGISDDTSAIVNRALPYLNSIGGGTLFLGAAHLISASIIISHDNVRIAGRARGGTLIKPSVNNIDLVKQSASYGGLENVHLSANGKTGIRGLVVAPEDESQTTARVDQNFNIFRDILIEGCDEGIYMKCGPDVGGGDSGCWYNSFYSIHLLNNLRGVLLDNGTGIGSAGVNRNQFYSLRFGNGNGSNTGIEIKSGDTNVFFGCSFEGIGDGTLPNPTPTALKIAQSGTYSGDNNSNRFFGCTWEACTRDIDLANAYTEFYGCQPVDSKCQWTTEPLIIIGNTASQLRQILPGYHYQSNTQKAGVDNNSLWADGANGFSAKSFDVREQSDNAGSRARSTLTRIGSIGSGASAAAVIVPAPKLNGSNVNIISGILTVMALSADNYPVYAEFRLIVRLTAGPVLAQWGQVEIYDHESEGANDWRASAANISVSSVSVSAGALVATVAAASAALSQVQVMFDHQVATF